MWLNSFVFIPFRFRFNIFKSENVHRSLFAADSSERSKDGKCFVDLNLDSGFSFSRFCDWSPQEIEDLHLNNIFYALLKHNSFQKTLTCLGYADTWNYPISTKHLLLTASISMKIMSLMTSNHSLFFTHWVSWYGSFVSSKIETILIFVCWKWWFARCRTVRSSHSLNTSSIQWRKRLSIESYGRNRQNWWKLNH